ncbi:MAG: hypothetical protein IH919_11580, partial [Deltaproteobacteria bacterium]|nr:hypothetical protein [Deltaproteobacteria bacterium]
MDDALTTLTPLHAAEPQVLQVHADVAAFTLFLQVDALPEELPLEVEVLDAAGNSIYQGVQDDSLDARPWLESDIGNRGLRTCMKCEQPRPGAGKIL